MVKITQKVFKANWKEYLWSSFITFSSFFIFSLAFILKDFNLESVEQSGLVGGAAIIIRLIGKASLNAFKEFVIWLSTKLKK
jgi:hypothetical protein